MHIGKNHNKDICTTLSVDVWKEEQEENENGQKEIKDNLAGRKDTKEGSQKKYLGDIISNTEKTRQM